MRIFITGGTGFVGTTLTEVLSAGGHQVTVLDRTIKNPQRFPGVSFIETDSTLPGAWQESAAEHEVFINLAGVSIFNRWSEKIKKDILNSRVLTTRNLVDAISRRRGREARLFSTSAVGYYGFHEEGSLAEDAPPGSDFLASVAVAWEAEALRAASFGAWVTICRFGIVLGRAGGALKQLIPLFRSFLGSPLGSGRQWFSWIHESDLVHIFLFLMGQDKAEGPFNCTAPEPVRNGEMTGILGKALGVPTFMPAVPGFMLKLILGEFGDILLRGQKAVPQRLLDMKYPFRFPTLREALQDLLKK
jgi:uncharacterized protein (TIGR01777 family)